MCAVPPRGGVHKDKDKEKDKATMIIATTVKNCVTVRLSADFQIDVEKVYYTVYCEGHTFEFGDFSPAAKVYKTLSTRIEASMTISDCLRNLASAARAFGYTVRKAVA